MTRSRKTIRSVVVAMLLTGLLMIASVASAHTHKVEKQCDSVTVNLDSYNASFTNTVEVIINGVSVYSNGNFGASFHQTFPYSGDGGVSVKIKVRAGDSNTYSFNENYTSEKCDSTATPTDTVTPLPTDTVTPPPTETVTPPPTDTVTPPPTETETPPPTDTVTPTVEPTTETPTVEPTTETPTVEPTTETPTVEPTTETPTVEPTTETPTVEPTTETPTVEPTTETPTVEPTTETPTVEPTTETPTSTSTVTDTPTSTATNTPTATATKKHDDGNIGQDGGEICQVQPVGFPGGIGTIGGSGDWLDGDHEHFPGYILYTQKPNGEWEMVIGTNEASSGARRSGVMLITAPGGYRVVWNVSQGNCWTAQAVATQEPSPTGNLVPASGGDERPAGAPSYSS